MSPLRVRVFALLAGTALFVAAACRSTEVKSATGVDQEAKTITLGMLAPLSGPVAVNGVSVTNGFRAYFQYVNEVLGGVGRDLDEEDRYQVELVMKDNQYTPDVQVQQYTAIKDQVLMLGMSFGTPTTAAILQQLPEDKMFTLATSFATEWLQQQWLIFPAAPFPVGFVNAGQYLKDQGAAPKVGVIYQDDGFGAEGLAGVEYAAEQFGFEIVARASYVPTDTNFTAQVNQMKEAGAETVFLMTIAPVTMPIIGAAVALDYAPQFIGLFPGWVPAFLGTPDEPSPAASYLQDHLWVITDKTCQWGDTGAGCEGMKEMIANLQKYTPDQKPDYIFQLGYTQAKLAHAVLEKAIADGDLTRDGLLKAYQSLKNVDMGGLLNPVSFGPTCEDKIPSLASTIWKVDPSQPLGLARLEDVESPTLQSYPFC